MLADTHDTTNGSSQDCLFYIYKGSRPLHEGFRALKSTYYEAFYRI